MKKLLLPIILILFFNLNILKAEEVTTANFLKLGVGARAVAMGSAFGGVYESCDSIYWNPSGIAGIRDREISLMYNHIFMEARQGFFVIVDEVKNIGNFGISVTYSLIEGIRKTNSIIDIDNQDTFNAWDLAVSLAFGRKINPKFRLGTNLKFLKSNIFNVSASGWAFDLGGLYIWRNLSIGFSIQNIGPKIIYQKKRENLPLNFKIGTSLRLKEKILINFDINKPIDNRLNYQIGGEYILGKSIFLRAGYSKGINDAGSGISLGLGIEFRNFNLDFSYVPYGELGEMYRTSFTIK
jgi:hypothetical protein